MNIGTKAGIATLSAGAVGGVAYSGYYHFSKDSFARKLGISLLNLTGTENDSVWNERLKEFKKANIDLDSNLKKESITEWEQLQKWCNDNQKETFSKDNKKFQNFETFCTWKMGDKIGMEGIPKEVEKGVEVWKKAYNEFVDRTKGKSLSKGLQELLAKKNESDQAKQEAMHKWCTGSYQKTWIGDDDTTFKETKEYCKK